MKKIIGYSLLLLSLSFSALNALASERKDSDLTPVKNGGIVYLNDGVGKEEQAMLKEKRKDFNLQLTFAEKRTGKYIADVSLSIEDMSGTKLLELTDMGPIFLAKLSPGKYRIRAKSEDKSQIKTVSVTGKGIKDLYFYW